MVIVNILSYNVRGLNSPEKRKKILKEISYLKADLTFLQETHLSHASNIRLYSKSHPTWYYADSPGRKSKGVAIGISRGLGFALESRMVDPEGRYLFLRGKIGDEDLTLVNIYSPNERQVDFLGKVLGKLMEFKKGGVILAGDLNLCLDPKVDTTSKTLRINKVQAKKIKEKLFTNQLADIWRILHPKDRDYTCYSSVHGTYSRLDYILIEHRWIERVSEAEIGVKTWSDHTPIMVKIKMAKERPRMDAWKINEEIFGDKKWEKEIVKELEFYFQINDTKDAPKDIVWEAHKAYMRGIFISKGTQRKKERIKDKIRLMTEVHQLEQKHKNTQDILINNLLEVKREELKDLLEQEIKQEMKRCIKEKYIESNKVGKNLAKILKKKKGKNFVDKIKNKNGEIIQTTTGIAKEFQNYYANLYAVKKGEIQGNETERREKIKKYLVEAGLTKIDEEKLTFLERPISEQEIERAIKETSLGKSPGPDGFTIGYYKKFKDILIPRFKEYINGIGTQYEMSREALSASITVIRKEGKDPLLCSSFRPISLLNVDTKLFTKILATRMKNLMGEWIHNDQVGFIPGRQGRDNGIKTILLIDHMVKSRAPSLLLSIDAEKAFDRVDWEFMINTLVELGIKPRMLAWIKTLYNQPTAKVKVNGTLSDSFKMLNGTRQGCPLSPMLFVLSLESLLATIRNSVDIGGIKVGQVEHKVSAFADDILLYISNPRITLPNIIKIMKQYGELSNLKMNQ